MFNFDTLLPSIIESAKKSPYIIYIKDIEDNFVFLNDAACKATNTNLETLKNKVFRPGSKEEEIYNKLFANDIEVINNGEPKSDIYFIGEKDDPFTKEACYFFTKQPLQDTKGQSFVLGFGIDMSNKLVGGSTLTFFKNILNSMTDAFIITDVDPPFRIRYANDAFVRLSGSSSFADVIGKSPTEVLKKELSEKKVRQEFNAKLARYEICDVVFTNTDSKGRKFKSHLKVIPLYHSNQEVPDYFVGVQRDITKSFITNRNLDNKREQLKAIFENISSFLWLVRADGVIVQMNRPARVQGKYVKPAEIINLKFIEGRWWKANEGSKEEIKKTVRSVLSKGLKENVTVDLLDAADRIRHVRLTINPSRDTNGDINYLVIEGADITEIEKETRQAETIAKASVNNPNRVGEWQKSGLEGDELERMVRTEMVLENIVPEVNHLSSVINDPETGLIFKVGETRDDVRKLVERTEASENVISFMRFVTYRVPLMLKNPIIKYALVAFLGASIFNTFGSTVVRVIEWVDVLGVDEVIKN